MMNADERPEDNDIQFGKSAFDFWINRSYDCYHDLQSCSVDAKLIIYGEYLQLCFRQLSAFSGHRLDEEHLTWASLLSVFHVNLGGLEEDLACKCWLDGVVLSIKMSPLVVNAAKKLTWPLTRHIQKAVDNGKLSWSPTLRNLFRSYFYHYEIVLYFFY